MSALRPIRDDEVARLWPAVKAARLFSTAEEFSAYRDAGPWRVRASDAGEAMVLGDWRQGADLLWIKGLWGSAHRVAELVAHAASVARGQGYSRVLSPLLSEQAFAPYAAAGMAPVESLVAIQAPVGVLVLHPSSAVTVRAGGPRDMQALLGVDAEGFEPFWRYGPAELASVMEAERLTVAALEGAIVGYSTISVHGESVTLGRIAVVGASRNRGVGQALLAEQVSHARARGASAITLCTQEANHVARAFYARCGMIELPMRYLLGVKDA